MKRTSLLSLPFAALLVLCAAPAASGMYHPTLGRFAQRDPGGYADSMNLQEYVRGQPLDKKDPSGLKVPSGFKLPSVLCTCCCVDDVTITGGEQIQGRLANRLFVNITYHYVRTDKVVTQPDCYLTWKEKSNKMPRKFKDADPSIKDNEWNDLYPKFQDIVPTFDSWKARPKTNLEPYTVTLPDQPEHAVGTEEQRVLMFAISVTSAKDCPCDHDWITVFGTQTAGGAGREAKSEFTAGVSAGELEGNYGPSDR